MAGLAHLPISVLADSYKAGHFEMYPEAKKMVAYGEFRRGYDGDKEDTRLVFYGIRYIVENFLNYKWTMKDVEQADLFYSTHNAGKTHYPFPRKLFEKFVLENDGYFPIKLEALPEGTVVNAHVPVYQITAEGEYSHLCTFFETILTQVWYPTCVATLSRRCREVIEAAFEKSVDRSSWWALEYRLHDFGMRGCTCVEQTVLGGVAHLLNFLGSDTMSACYYAQFTLNNGRPVAESIPASEHSVMTAWKTEADAVRNMIQKFGGDGKLFSVVMDSYDYEHALDHVLPSVASEHAQQGGTIVLRPDSGDPALVVLEGLKAGEKTFGADVNSKGYKVLRRCRVIQGDGISYDQIKRILSMVLAEGYSAENVAYGMGGGLLQRCNRDTMSFATKLSYMQYADGTERDIMKKPKSDAEKVSFPGILAVKRVGGIPTIFPAEDVKPEENLLRVVYDRRPVANAFPEEFDALRKRVHDEWLAVPPKHNPVSEHLKSKITAWIADLNVKLQSNL